jgi:acetyl-CoA acyltransferase
VAIAADRIRVGEADVMIAGGAESMSMVPMVGNKPSFNAHIFERDENLGIAYGMGMTAEKVAAQWKVSREAQDEFACLSHTKAIAAQKAGEFTDEITPIEVVEKFPDLASREVAVTTKKVPLDEGPRADTNREALGRLKPVFAAKGSVTAGNSSQMSDGAGALILASEKAVKQFGLTPLARFVSFAIRGVPPEIMGIGPKEAIPVALRLAGLKADDMGWIELNEAFAAQALAVIGDLGLDASRVNPMGGAIALGHPLGATGAIRSATVVHALRRRNLKHGMVTMCVGTGMGAAGIFERV